MEEDMNLPDRNESSNKKLLKDREKRFKKNLSKLQKLKPKIQPGQSSHLREIVSLFLQTMSVSDLIAFQNGTHYSEAFINFYFTILSKVNLILLKTQ